MKKYVILLFCFSMCNMTMAQNTFSHWYDNIQETYSYNIQGTTIFSDSTVLAVYSDGAGGTLLAPVDCQGIGEIFDPKSGIYDNPITSYRKYTVDSIGLPYRYNYVYEANASPDTLIFQFYTMSGIDSGTLSANISLNFPKEPYATVSYDYIKNLGKKSIGQYAYILSASDDTKGAYKTIKMATNGLKGIRLNANELFAFTVSYRPGFIYNFGDTIDESWSSTPKNLHSHFSVFAGISSTKYSNKDYEESLSIITGNRYNKSPNWNGRYIPGTAWVGYNQILWAQFHTTPEFACNDAQLTGFDYSHWAQCGGYPIGVRLTNTWPYEDIKSATISWLLDGIKQKDYQWTGNLGQNKVVTILLDSIKKPGNHYIKAWVSLANAIADSVSYNDTISDSVVIHPFPNAHFSVVPILWNYLQFVPQDSNLFFYNWDFGNGSTAANTFSPTQIFKEGTYTVKLGVSDAIYNGCISIHDSTIVIIKTGIPEVEANYLHLNIYPNPCKGQATIEYQINSDSRISIDIYNEFGQYINKILDKTECTGQHQYTFNLDQYGLKQGIYLLKVSTQDGYSLQKLVTY